MREKRDFKLRRSTGRTLTPEKLIGILKSVETDKIAKEKYKELTGLNPPPEAGEFPESLEDIENAIKEIAETLKRDEDD